MAIIKAINSKSSVSHIVNYVSDKNKTSEELMYGKDCSSNPTNAIEDMKTTKELYNKEGGRQYKHFVQSFNPKDNITPEKAQEIGVEWAEKNFKGYEVFLATHTDKDHLHNHFVVNTVNFETGEKYRYSKADLNKYKEISDKICEREGLTKTPSKSKDITTFNSKKYKAIAHGMEGTKKSYLIEIGKTVEKNIEISSSKQNFINNMERDGYKVKWSDTAKNVTYEDKEGHKVRSSNLEKTFKEEKFNKEQMLKQFQQNKELVQEKIKEPKQKNENNKRKVTDDNGSQEIIFEINKIKGEIKRLNDNKARLEKSYKENSDKARDYANKLSMNERNINKISQLNGAIGKEKERKNSLTGLKGLFKGAEKRNCDERIQKYETNIEELKGKLLKPEELKEIKAKHDDFKSKAYINKEKLNKCEIQLETKGYKLSEKENSLDKLNNKGIKVDEVEKMFAKDEKALKTYKDMKAKGDFKINAPKLDKDLGREM